VEQAPIVRRRIVASFRTYPEAERAMDHLADHDFPVERARIVGEGLRMIEQVTGRFGWTQALASGALAGAVVGGFVGWIAGLVATPGIGFGFFIFGLVLGAVAGMIANALTYWMGRGSRDFTSLRRMEAERYLLLVEDEVAAGASELLGRLPGHQAATAGAMPARADDATSDSDDRGGAAAT
jgi:hypothetical protein